MIEKKFIDNLEFLQPLKTVVISVDESRIIDGRIYAYNPYYFVLSKDKSSGDYLIRSCLIANSDSAAYRALLDNIENYNLSECLELENEILGVESYKYSDVINYLKNDLCEKILESASYRFKDGKFIHKKIGTKKYEFYYLGEKIDSNELPYAILFKLSWKKIKG